MDRGKKLLQGSLFSLIKTILLIVIGFFMLPFLIHNLGDKTYGLWVLVMTFIDYYILLRMGFSSATSRHLARAVGVKDTEEMSKISSTVFFLLSYNIFSNDYFNYYTNFHFWHYCKKFSKP